MHDIHQQIIRLGLDVARSQAASKAERGCIEAAAAVAHARRAQLPDLGYATLASICLPHKSRDRSPDPRRWRQQVDEVSAVLESGSYPDGRPIGIPFGSKARIILLYLTTQAVQSATPEVELGPTMYAWLRAMDSRASGGMTYRLFREQARRIAAMSFEVQIRNGATVHLLRGRGIAQLQLADGSAPTEALYQRPHQETSFPLRAVLERPFCQATRFLCCAIRLSALRQLANNSGAIDLYVWLSHRLAPLRAPVLVGWPELTAMFGAGYRHARQMKPGFINALNLALAVYPEARVERSEAGLQLFPSDPPIRTADFGPRRRKG